MKRIFPSLLLGCLCATTYATNLQRAVDKLINQVDPNINMGIAVIDLDTDETLYQRHATNTFVPASNMKLFSDAAALLALGPDYRFQNTLSTNATLVDNGTLKGSIYLKLPGDPSLSQDNIDALLSPLAAWGVNRIQGNVVLVSNNSAVTAYAPGRMAEDSKYSYGAPVAPLVLNENRLTVTVNPAYRAGQPAYVELSNPNTGLILNNQVKTTETTKGCGLDFNLDESNHLTVRGCVGVGQWAVQQRIPIRNPLRFTQELIKLHLANMHIQLEGQVVLGSAPPSSLLLASHLSKPITQIMADTLKPSDNVYADSLFLHTAAKLNGSPVSWQQAQPVVKQFLQQQTGINLQQAVLTDGSGLSRQDQLTPEQTVRLLRFLHNRFPLSYEYIAALPIAGSDGTLQRRFRKPTQQGLLRAKTGTMRGVISLSGYLYTANAHTLAFAIFINKRPSTKPAVSGRYRYLVDTLCDFFLQQRPDNRRVASSANPHARVAFQQQPTQADRQRGYYARWRQLESAVKQSLRGQAVSVVFRGDQLILQDHGADVNTVWNTLQNLGRKYAFAVALQGTTAPTNAQGTPMLLWIKTPNAPTQAARTWTLREAVGSNVMRRG